MSRQFNEVSVSYRLARREVETPFVIRELSTFLNVSPTCSVWPSSRSWTTDEIEADPKEHGIQEDKEYALRREGIAVWPTIAGIYLGVEADVTEVRFCEWLLQAITQSIPETLLGHGISGAAGFSVGEEPGGDAMPNMGYRLAQWPGAVPMLTDLFADLHPFLIGPAKSCLGLAAALGRDRVKVRVRQARTNRQELAVLYIPPDIVSDPGARIAARHWLVPRNESTAGYVFGNAPGEYCIGGRCFYTQRRYEELRRMDRVPPVSGLSRPFIVIQDKYSMLLGVDPDDMLLDFFDEQNRQEENIKVDRHFEQLPADMPVGERVWRAYRRYWLESYPPASEAFLNFMYGRYLRE